MEFNKENFSVCGIYVIINKINNKKYVGKAKNIYKRIKQHILLLNKKSKDENRFLINSWHKYGFYNFEFKILEKLPLIESLLSERELYWINYYTTTNSDFGYNLRLDSSTFMITHEKTKKLMSQSQKERYSKFTEEQLKDLGNKSKKFWEENPDKKLEMIEKIRVIKQKYSIIQYTKDMLFVKEYEGRNDIVNNYKDFYIQAILAVCNGSKATYKGFIWRYKDLKTGKIIEQKSLEDRKEKSKIRKKSKLSFLLKNNEIIEYPTLSSLCNENNLYISNINNNLKTKEFIVLKNKNFMISYKKEVLTPFILNN